MSGIYIPNMKMPKGANDCEFSDEFFTCSLNEERCALERMGIGCPLVFVPDHGRLIDADKIPFVTSEDGVLEDWAFRYDINDMPTIIQADKEEA